MLESPCVAGKLMDKELVYLYSAILSNPRRPLAAIVGGSKVSTKVPVLSSLITQSDGLYLGIESPHCPSLEC
jgi:phosphoglycerate kinase